MQERTGQRYRYTGLYLLAGTALFIKLVSIFPDLVEKYYSTGVYPVISRVQRFLFGWMPLSFGDLLYAIATIGLVYALVKFIRAIMQKRIDLKWLLRAGVKVMRVWLWVYILFNLLWGLNYNRVGITRQAGIRPGQYTTAELDSLVQVLSKRMEADRTISLPERQPLRHKRTLFTRAFSAYQQPGTRALFLKYGGQSVKPSLYSYLGNYLGFTGYYNPFTGEAQVNTTVPVFVQPFTTCHEIGHQLGYARENEANMAGFLTASKSESPAFRYSAYFDLYLYAIRDLNLRDSALAQQRMNQLPAGVKEDIITLRKFNQEHVGLLEPLVRTLYAQYLRANQQPSGLLSYNQVVALVIAYGRKYGWERL
ncbi:DUF3810 domain-containing protein [Flavihumibacter cheonanensis]|uniref:DUF3810 domain-containing protein n=1 Tax=Flavihumibacter cheonanensis TaxID=1442385 RepID=UPI001EF760B8|nr:DUF3810 domain-containing protein [Flavihumibacter cheonanensis]MCG7752319.1 DUF3810 domain-containing protein [Flavihumibacter cheonanensis]